MHDLHELHDLHAVHCARTVHDLQAACDRAVSPRRRRGSVEPEGRAEAVYEMHDVHGVHDA